MDDLIVIHCTDTWVQEHLGLHLYQFHKKSDAEWTEAFALRALEKLEPFLCEEGYDGSAFVSMAAIEYGPCGPRRLRMCVRHPAAALPDAQRFFITTLANEPLMTFEDARRGPAIRGGDGHATPSSNTRFVRG